MPEYYGESSGIERVYEKIYKGDQFHKCFVKTSDKNLTDTEYRSSMLKIFQHTRSCGQKYRFELTKYDVLSKD